MSTYTLTLDVTPSSSDATAVTKLTAVVNYIPGTYGTRMDPPDPPETYIERLFMHVVVAGIERQIDVSQLLQLGDEQTVENALIEAFDGELDKAMQAEQQRNEPEY